MNRKIDNPPFNRRASVSGLKAVITIEAAIGIPIFLFAVVCLIYLLEIQAVRVTVRAAAQNAAKEAAEDVAVYSFFSSGKVQADLVQTIGIKRLSGSIVEGGGIGLFCGRSEMREDTHEIRVVVTYRVRLLVPGIFVHSLRLEEEVLVKGWTGYEVPGLSGKDDQIVYITDTASVYHQNYQCTYLQLSIRFVPYASLSELRSSDGRKYKVCEKCVQGGAMAGVYVTEDGEKYHNSLTCSGLKRTIHAVHRSEVEGLGGCSRCTN